MPKKEYQMPCSLCGEMVTRSKKRSDASCFKCKKLRQQRLHFERSKSGKEERRKKFLAEHPDFVSETTPREGNFKWQDLNKEQRRWQWNKKRKERGLPPLP